MSTHKTITKVTIGENEDVVILTHTLERSQEAKLPMTIIVPFVVDAAGELTHQIMLAIRKINDRRFERSGIQEKVFHTPTGRSHA